jgi:nucleotide-binding universal stress UspA family protein
MSKRIVVGVDGSGNSHGALAWAVGEARIRGAELDVVQAWEYLGIYTVDPESKKRALADLHAAVAGFDTTGVDVKAQLVEGRPVDALVKAAKGADLVVVGSRGHSGLSASVLGSVSAGVMHHAGCPIVVVPPPRP